MGGSIVKSFIGAGIMLLGYVTPVVRAQTVSNTKPSGAVVSTAIVSIDAAAVPLKEVLQDIARQAGLSVVYGNHVEKSRARVTMRIHHVTVGEAFERALMGTGLRAIINQSDVFFVSTNFMASSEPQGGISGKVTDANTKQPLRGVTVTIDEARQGVVTDEDGRFTLANVSPGSHMLTARRLGHTKATQPVVVTEGQITTVEVVLQTSTTTLDQVVVTGTIIPTELKAVPNAITVITAKEIERRGITQISQLFRGDVPGLFAVNVGSQSGLDTVTMFSRGATSLQTAASTTPIKTYVDGIELANPVFLNQIDPKSIERIEILTGPQASTIYGSNAINGVMQIFTKRGASSRPQLTLSLISGVIQSSVSSALTPRHDGAVQVNGIEGRVSYNAGAGWQYVGPWTPTKRTTTSSSFGGVRFQASTRYGTVTADASLRLGNTQNKSQNFGQDELFANIATGAYSQPSTTYGLSAPHLATLDGQTLGGSISYMPAVWLSQSVEAGTDISTMQIQASAPIFSAPYDTTLSLSQTRTQRTSLRYAATAQIPITPLAHLAVTAGGDAWQSLMTSISNASLVSLTGTLGGSPSVGRQPSHNAGAFAQGQLAIGDAVFLTYGLRAEWNPNYGSAAQPNTTPRYGIAYTQNVGGLTAKIRASYGRATRPPTVLQKARRLPADVGAFFRAAPNFYGTFDAQRANADLGPEYQHGGEGGLDLYFGTRASLIVTRYNQMVDGLIVPIYNDSVKSLRPNALALGVLCQSIDAAGYCYLRTFQNINVASIRNDGWELQPSLTIGPVTTKMVYSWTRSRILGLTQGLSSSNVFGPGAYNLTRGGSFGYLPEHTWAMSTTYANAATTVTLNLNGTGQLSRPSGFDALSAGVTYDRLNLNRPRMDLPAYVARGAGYVLADVNVSQHLASHIQGLLQIQNLANVYQNDYSALYSTPGRQTNIGLRMTF